MSRPIVPLLIALMAGITGSFIFEIPDLILQLSLLALLSLILLVLTRKGHASLPFLVIVALFLLGMLEMNLYLHPRLGHDHIRYFLGNEKVTVEGGICESPLVSPERTEIVVSVSRMLREGQYSAVSGRILLSVREGAFLRYGDRIRFRCRLRAPHNFKNPGAFDYERYLRLRGIEVRGFINDQTDLVVLRRGCGNALRIGLERFREHIRKAIMQESPGTEGKVILAMLLGDQKGIPQEVMEAFNKTGTTHIIAISGFNIGIVAVFCLAIIRFLMKSSEYLLLRWNMAILSSGCAILPVILYSFIAGAGIAVVRAAIMVVVFMAATLVDRERDHYNTLALAAFIILILSPYSLFDVSFQLSFLAVFFLLFLTPRLMALVLPPSPSAESIFPNRGGWIAEHLAKALRVIIVFCLVSLSATLGTLPLIILYFNRLSLVSLAANLVVVPILGVMAIPVFLLLILAVPLSATLAQLLIGISELLVRISIGLVSAFADLSWSSVFLSTPSLLEVGAFYLLLIATGFCLDGWAARKAIESPKKSALLWKITASALILFFIGDGIYLHLKDLQRDRLTLTAVDVGQGSSTLLRLPGGKKILVDGGGFFDDTFDVGRYVLAPFLWHERISKIDLVVLTHPHPDHLQGLIFILENFHVTEVWTNGQEIDSPLYITFRRVIGERGIPMKVISDRTPDISLSKVGIRFLSPPADPEVPLYRPIPSEKASSGAEDRLIRPMIPPMPRTRDGAGRSDEINDRSIVLKLSFGLFTFLLPGDISEKTEWRISRSGVNLQSDVLFVPHHGGFRSSTMPFLERVAPEVAVISCGVENVFRDPHPEVLRRLDGMRALCFRTDRDGAISMETDGIGFKVKVFKK